MAEHDVEFSIPPRPLGRADVSFTVRAEGEMVGTLLVSKGSLVWFPPGHTIGKRLRWEAFAEFMEAQSDDEERR